MLPGNTIGMKNVLRDWSILLSMLNRMKMHRIIFTGKPIMLQLILSGQSTSTGCWELKPFTATGKIMMEGKDILGD
jgi:hypothetical protein